MMPLRAARGESMSSSSRTVGGAVADLMAPLKPPSPSSRSERCSEDDGGETNDRRSAFVSGGKVPSDRSFRRTPSFHKIDLDDTPLPMCGGGGGGDDATVATAATFDSGWNSSSDLSSYVSQLRSDMLEERCRQRLQEEGKKKEEAQAAAEMTREGGFGCDGSGEENVEKYRNMCHELTAELESVTRILNDQQAKIDKKKGVEQSASMVMSIKDNVLSAVPVRRGGERGPLRKLASFARLTPLSSERSISSCPAQLSVAEDVAARPVLPVLNPALSRCHAKEDPRLSEIAELRFLLSEIDSQNDKRDRIIRDLTVERNALEGNLESKRNEQLDLTMSAITEDTHAGVMRCRLEAQSLEVARLRKKIERGHEEVEVLKRKVTLWSSSLGGSLQRATPRRYDPSAFSANRVAEQGQRGRSGSRAKSIAVHRQQQQQRQQQPALRRLRNQRSSFADIGGLLSGLSQGAIAAADQGGRTEAPSRSSAAGEVGRSRRGSSLRHLFALGAESQ